MKAWYFPQWDDLYESNKSRTVVTLTYFMQPNKLDGEGIGLLRMQPDWLELYGVLGFIKILASKSERAQRGWLVRGKTALTPQRMAALTGIPVPKIERALKFFSTPPMDWMAFDECPGTAPTPSGHHPGTTPAPDGHSTDTVSPRLMTEEVAEDLHTPIVAGAPSPFAIRNWAVTNDVDPDFAVLKARQAAERGDFAQAVWQKRWQSKLLRFWREDGPDWKAKNQKKRRAAELAAAERLPTDPAHWWTDPLDALDRELSGLAMMEDEKTAARLRDIIKLRTP